MFRYFIEQVVGVYVLTLPIWIITRIIINVSRKKKGENISISREITINLFFLYLVLVSALTLIPTHIMKGLRHPSLSDINFVPVFNTIKSMQHTPANMQHFMVRFWLENIIGNVFLLFPLGIFLPLLSVRFRSMKLMVFTALGCSLFIETFQFISRYIGSFRTCDIDDVILNTLGAALGYVGYRIITIYTKEKI